MNIASLRLLSCKARLLAAQQRFYSIMTAPNPGPNSVTFAPADPEIEVQQRLILNPACLEFLTQLHLNFESRRQSLLSDRVARQKVLDSDVPVDFLKETEHVRSGTWTIARLPSPLLKRRVEITGPVDRKMVVNALNSGADCYMADFEDSSTPTWANQLSGQVNLFDAIRDQIDFTAPDTGKQYKLNKDRATLMVRPRGWHLEEKHVSINGQRMSGSLFDFGVYFFHNTKELLYRGLGPYFYLPKLEGHLEARLWNDVFVYAQESLGVPQGTIKATVLIETILAALEMDEILYELRDHSAGLNAGRWDYIFSCIKKFRNRKPEWAFGDRKLITMDVPFMRAYSLHLVHTCHKRNAPAIGGMAAFIPIKEDLEANKVALGKVREDKARDARDGFDGSWVAHPGLVGLALDEVTRVLGDRPNQIDKQQSLGQDIKSSDLLTFGPSSPITEEGLRHNVVIALEYLANWLNGTGCVPIFNLMEDAATAEISRSQIWQWTHSSKGVLDDGRKVTVDLVHDIVNEEVAQLKTKKTHLPYDKAAEFFARIATSEEFEDFLTLPLYESMK